MNSFPKKALLWVLLLCSTLCLASCDSEDRWASDMLTGSWRVVETSGGYGPCPYRSGDRMDFSFDGYYYVWSGYDGYSEEGYWDIDDGNLLLDALYDGTTDAVCRIRQMDNDYLVLDVRDYTYDSSYRLRLVRYGY